MNLNEMQSVASVKSPVRTQDLQAVSSSNSAPGGFGAALQQAHSAGDESEARATLRGAAEQLVSTAFITPMLGSLREHSFAEGPFAPNTAEKRFGPMLDQQIADRVTEAANFSLVDAIVDRYLPRDEPDAATSMRTVA